MSDTPITDAAISTDYYCSGMVDGDVARDIERAANAMAEALGILHAHGYQGAIPYDAIEKANEALAQYRKLKP